MATRLDPNLMKIRDANMNLIKENRFGVPITQAKDYLFYILGPNKMAQINEELDGFVDHMKDIYESGNRQTQAHS